MTLGHEKLDVYSFSIDYVVWVLEVSERSCKKRRARKSTEPMRSIPIAISIPMKQNINRTVGEIKGGQAVYL